MIIFLLLFVFRELNAKELAMYNSLFGVKSIFMQTLTTKVSK